MLRPARMAKLKTHNCPSCSAPLEVSPQQSDITCRYCGNAIHIERAPAPRVPGPVVNHQVMYIDPNAGRGFARAMMIVGFLPLLIPVGIFVVPLITRKLTSVVRPRDWAAW